VEINIQKAGACLVGTQSLDVALSYGMHCTKEELSLVREQLKNSFLQKLLEGGGF